MSKRDASAMADMQALYDAITMARPGTSQVASYVPALDPALAGLADRLSEASYLISDVAGELASYTESLDSDPARLAAGLLADRLLARPQAEVPRLRTGPALPELFRDEPRMPGVRRACGAG